MGRSQFTRAVKYPSQTLLRIRFGVGFVLAIAFLGGLGYVVGRGAFGSGFVRAETKALQLPAVSSVLALVGVLFASWCARRLWFEYLAWKPGTIHVPNFLDSSLHKQAPCADLTSEFRNRLATLHLEAATPAPGSPPPSDFLDIFNEGASGGSVGQVVKFVRATFPSSALSIQGRLLERNDQSSERYGLSIQVSRLPDQGVRLDDIWDTSWERAVRRAADAATAAILPRTRLCRGPWIPWRGYVMPAELFSGYEEALTLGPKRDYLGALAACYRALEHDPLNRAIRLELGKLQEQLGLSLDALETYEGILTAARPDEHGLPRRLYRYRARVERTRLEHIVRYRLIVLLGADQIVDQWERMSPGEANRREDQVKNCFKTLSSRPRSLRKLRHRRERSQRRAQEDLVKEARASRTTNERTLQQEQQLLSEKRHPMSSPAANVDAVRAEFERRHEDRLREIEGWLARERRRLEEARAPDEGEIALLLKSIRPGDDGNGATASTPAADARLQLCTLLAEGARAWAQDLIEDLHRWRRRHWLGELHLLPTTVTVTRACIDERLDQLAGSWAGENDNARLEKMERRVKRAAPRSWQSHYNAACLYAIPLIEERIGRNDDFTRAIVERAIAHLKIGAGFADSGFLASRRDWLTNEDPDLTDLRRRPEFVGFVKMYFPAGSQAPSRPKRAEEIVLANYTRQLLHNFAAGWADAWTRRGKTRRREYDWRELAGWWRDERAAWDLVFNFALASKYWDPYVYLNLKTQLALIGAQRHWHARYDVQYAETPLLSYEMLHEQAPNSLAGDDGDLIAEIRLLMATLSTLLAQRKGNPGPSPHRVDRPQAWLTDDGAPLSVATVATMCEARARLWQHTSVWLTIDSRGTSGQREGLESAIAAVRDQEPWWQHSAHDQAARPATPTSPRGAPAPAPLE